MGKALKEGIEIKSDNLINQSSQLIRTWTVPLTSVIERKDLKPHLSNIEKAMKAEGSTRKEVKGWLHKQATDIKTKLSENKITPKEAKTAGKKAVEKARARRAMIFDSKAKPVLDMTDTTKAVLEKGLYNPDTAAVQAEINKALKASKNEKVVEFAEKIEHGSVGDTAKVLEVIHYENAKTAGAEYTPILKQIAEDKRYNKQGELGKTIVDSAKEALIKHK